MNAIAAFLGAPVTLCGLLSGGALLLILLGICVKGRHEMTVAGLCFTAMLVTAASLLLSRAAFVLANLSLYEGRPEAILRLNDGGFSVMTAVMTAVLSIRCAECVFGPERGTLMDGAAVMAPLTLILLRIGDKLSGLGDGRPVTYDWLRPICVYSEAVDAWVLPVWLMEIIAAAVIFLIVLRAARGYHRPGYTARLFILLFGLSQVLLESLRDDGYMVMVFIRIEQVLSILLPAVMMALIPGQKRMKPLLGWPLILLAVGAAIGCEFAADRTAYVLESYLGMTAMLCLIGWIGLGWIRDADR